MNLDSKQVLSSLPDVAKQAQKCFFFWDCSDFGSWQPKVCEGSQMLDPGSQKCARGRKFGILAAQSVPKLYEVCQISWFSKNHRGVYQKLCGVFYMIKNQVFGKP